MSNPDATSEPGLAAAASSTGTASGETVLVVDDDPQIVRLVRAYLEQAGFRVRTAGDGEDALHIIRSERPALVVLDLMLPRRDGLDVTRIVRADPLLAATPILMLTARVEDVDRIVGLELGADDYVAKPFHPREVVARVKAILRRASAQPGVAGTLAGTIGVVHQPPIVLHGVSLDPVAHSVMADERPVSLTPSEFTVLHLLMRSPGRVFSRTQIIEEGLGHDYEGLERTVDSHIRNLRRKLEADPRHPQRIETVFGVGYRFALSDTRAGGHREASQP